MAWMAWPPSNNGRTSATELTMERNLLRLAHILEWMKHASPAPVWSSCGNRVVDEQSRCRGRVQMVYWRWRSESNDAFTDHQPQHPELHAHFDTGFRGVQARFTTTRRTPDLYHHLHPTDSVIEETVEGFDLTPKNWT